MKYANLYADMNGISHWKDVDVDFIPVEFAPPAPPVHLSPFIPTKQYAFFKAPIGWYGDRHTAPARQIFFFLEGELEVMAGDGETRRYHQGVVAELSVGAPLLGGRLGQMLEYGCPGKYVFHS